jgi:hypothetical protein
MLMNVLKALATGNVYNQAELAKQLGISEGLLAQMMEDLAQRGYLAPLSADSNGGCGGCSGCGQAKACTGCPSQRSNVIKGWTLTAKGLARAQR